MEENLLAWPNGICSAGVSCSVVGHFDSASGSQCGAALLLIFPGVPAWFVFVVVDRINSHTWLITEL